MEETIMKRKVLILVMGAMLAMGLTACDADKVNDAIHAVGDAAGVDTTDINLEQETVDEIKGKVDDAIKTGNKIMQDEDVSKAIKGVADAVKNAAASSEESQSDAE